VIALKDLALIEKAMKQPGDWRTKPAPGQPAPEQLTVTTCQAGKPAMQAGNPGRRYSLGTCRRLLTMPQPTAT
jgi:hypothetical protein